LKSDVEIYDIKNRIEVNSEQFSEIVQNIVVWKLLNYASSNFDACYVLKVKNNSNWQLYRYIAHIKFSNNLEFKMWILL